MLDDCNVVKQGICNCSKFSFCHALMYFLMNPVGFLTISLCAVFCYVWEPYWDSVFPRSSSSLSTVCRSKSGSLCVCGFSVGLQGHLMKTEKREPVVYGYCHTTVSLQLDGGSVWYGKSGAKHTVL